MCDTQPVCRSGRDEEATGCIILAAGMRSNNRVLDERCTRLLSHCRVIQLVDGQLRTLGEILCDVVAQG